MQLFDAKVDKELIQEWTGILRQLGSSSQKKPQWNWRSVCPTSSSAAGSTVTDKRNTVEKVS